MIVGNGPTRLRVVLVTLTVLTCVLTPIASAESGFAGPSQLGDSQVDPDAVSLAASVHENGSASWTVQYLVQLESANRTEAFQSLQADVRANRSAYVDRFEQRMNRTVAAAEDATGREMALRDVTVETGTQSIGQQYGVVTYRFEWDGFAVTTDDQLRAGDAVAGLYLDPETSLRVRWPDSYQSVSVDPVPDETEANAVVWNGRQSFSDDEPQLVVTKGAGEASSAANWWLLPTIAGVLAIGAGLVGLWLVRRGEDTGSDADESAGPAGPLGDDRAGATGPAEQAASEPPEELLSNEERVLKLLDEQGGRIKQQQVVERLGWTDAKTSQVVSDMREAGSIEVFRIGRENVLRLPDADDQFGPSDSAE